MSGAKVCECGCGQPTKIAPKTNRRLGHVKGQPMRLLQGHAARLQQRGKCSVDGCDGPHDAAGFCASHYWRWRKYGTPLAGRQHGMSRTPTYSSWRSMIQRCTNPNAADFEHYGGRGIRVCDRWRGPDGFPNFLADLGERPDGRTLHRINVDEGYSPENCRWATVVEQRHNQRRQTPSEQKAEQAKKRAARAEA